MADPITINLRHVARGLDIPLEQVEAVVELLDEGNTVPFITRYRKDQTKGLDEEQIRQIQGRLAKARQLAERKQTILRSIEAQGKLTEKLARQIQGASTTKRLEDLYLPFKPKKQTLATLARSRGLELLAQEILTAAVGGDALDARAADFANSDRQVPTAADALLGAGHILAEQFSENAELRQRLRDVLQRTGKLVSAQIIEARPEKPERPERPEKTPATQPTESTAAAETAAPAVAETTPPVAPAVAETTAPAAVETAQAPSPEAAPQPQPSDAQELPPDQPAAEPIGEASAEPAPVAVEALSVPGAEAGDEVAQPLGVSQQVEAPPAPDAGEEPTAELVPAPEPATEAAVPQPLAESPALPAATEANAPGAEPAGTASAEAVPPPAPRPAVQPSAKAKSKPSKAELRREKKEEKKKKAEQRKLKAFSDYFDYSEELRKIPPHRILAINRGERARVLRVRIDADLEEMYRAVDEVCVPPDHPHADFLRGCARDALVRLILPSLEREIRRELTERAEAHAVEVFARNLRNLLLQPPVRDRRVLAVDPGFKSGCKLAALDQFGNILAHDMMYLVGKPERRDEAKRKIAEMIEHFQLTVIVIGNGTACRETEDFIAELVGQELKDKGICYVIVNEAGASVYSTSRLGREEFPQYDATLRGAISIGRRLQDPLSELVKIEPANIGVGLYQHDVKAKHLQESLDEVVESCVNFVGVDVNTASPALLRYVSGLNQLTARRLYDHRLQHGPFRSRQQLKEVPGIGEATFVQAAGFLKIAGGDDPLDATWIHPESYPIAGRVMEKLGITAADLANKDSTATLAERIAKVDAKALAAELQVGLMSLKDILAQLARPGRDPREDLPPPIFKKGILKLEDLTPGMELTGTVLNVVDFGAFVDIGMHDSGLVHVSQMADRFVRDPHEVLAVGDVVKVWVQEVDKQRRRVSLTMIPPGHSRQGPQRHGRPEGRGREGRPSEGQAQPAGAAREGRPPRPEGAPRSGGGPRPQGPPRRHDRPPQGRRPPSGQGPKGPPPQRVKPPPKPLPPLTDEMKTGKAPLRTFGDLLQFYEIQHGKPPAGQKDQGRGKDQGRKKDDGRKKGKDGQPKGDEGRPAEEAKKPAEAAPAPAAPASPVTEPPAAPPEPPAAQAEAAPAQTEAAPAQGEAEGPPAPPEPQPAAETPAQEPIPPETTRP